MKILTPPPTPPLQGRGAATAYPLKEVRMALPSLVGEGLGVGSVSLFICTKLFLIILGDKAVIHSFTNPLSAFQ